MGAYESLQQRLQRIFAGGRFSDWKTRAGLSLAVVFWLATYVVKEMSPWMACTGIAICLAFASWEVFPFAKKSSWKHELLALTAVALISGALSYHFIRDNPKEAAARRWVVLSQEIWADYPTLKYEFNTSYDSSLPKEVQIRLWNDETKRMLRNTDEAMNQMRRRYQSRIEQARIEMVEFGILKPDPRSMFDNSHMTNAFDWERWASRLGAEGHKILGD